MNNELVTYASEYFKAANNYCFPLKVKCSRRPYSCTVQLNNNKKKRCSRNNSNHTRFKCASVRSSGNPREGRTNRLRFVGSSSNAALLT